MKDKVEISIPDLRRITTEVMEFLSVALNEPVDKINIKTSINRDLRIQGDDVDELFSIFIDKYHVNFDEFDFDKYFVNEGVIANSIAFNLHTLPIRIFYYLYLVLSGNEEKDGFKFVMPKLNKVDMTVGDLVTSVIKGKFTPRNEISFIKSNQSSTPSSI